MFGGPIPLPVHITLGGARKPIRCKVLRFQERSVARALQRKNRAEISVSCVNKRPIRYDFRGVQKLSDLLGTLFYDFKPNKTSDVAYNKVVKDHLNKAIFAAIYCTCVRA